MKPRTVTVASFFSVAMAATLVGALYTTQVQRPRVAHASAAPEAQTAVDQAATAQQAARGTNAAAPLGLETFRDIAKVVNPSVVNINTSKVVRLPRYRDPFHGFGGGDDLLDRFFGFGPDDGGEGSRGGGSGREQRRTQTSLGSGFVIDRDGYILTNRHVIEGADEISVTFPRSHGRRYTAKVVGQDARTDVALIKIDPAGASLNPLPLGDSDRLDVGEWVMAVGNPFGLGDNSVTVGVVSYMGRDIPLEGVNRGTSVQMIQTDAAINPGNSGGPLINTRGEVVGINTMIITGGGQANAGVGFSVPVNVAKEILPQLREKGKVTRGWMGVTIGPMTEDLAPTFGLKVPEGAVVNSVQSGSPAEKAGLQPEDVVLSADGRRIENNGDLSRYIAGKTPGSTVRLEVLRGKENRTVNVTLGTFPDEPGGRENDSEGRASNLGMTLRDLSPQMAERLELPRGTRGVVVMDVEAGQAAEDAGLLRGDVIVSVNGQPVDGLQTFERAIDQSRAEGRARLRIRRGEQFFVVVLKVGK
ncbi:MAG TPA: Do family serine endopeptidase [Vicinamibacteria bacterium]|nr:Do family serine endopeptidase [Vicinamibacteria bacterium]